MEMGETDGFRGHGYNKIRGQTQNLGLASVDNGGRAVTTVNTVLTRNGALRRRRL